MSVFQSRNLQDQKALVTARPPASSRDRPATRPRRAEVIVHGRDAERGAATVEEIIAAGGQARFLAADLGKPAEVRRLAKTPATSTSWSTTPGSRSSAPRGARRRAVRCPLRRQRPRSVHARGRARLRGWQPEARQHRQHRQHGWRHRSRGRRGVRSDEGRARVDDAGLGGGNSVPASPGEPRSQRGPCTPPMDPSGI